MMDPFDRDRTHAHYDDDRPEIIDEDSLYSVMDLPEAFHAVFLSQFRYFNW